MATTMAARAALAPSFVSSSSSSSSCQENYKAHSVVKTSLKSCFLGCDVRVAEGLAAAVPNSRRRSGRSRKAIASASELILEKPATKSDLESFLSRIVDYVKRITEQLPLTRLLLGTREIHGDDKLVTKEEGLLLYEDMVLGRTFEDMCAQMYYRGKMFGFVHLYNGQEAVSTGCISLLKKTDFVCSTYRDHVHALSKGVPPRLVMAELYGKSTGCCRGQGGSMHMFSAEHGLLGGFAFIGEGIPVATGAAFTTVYKREVLKDSKADAVTMAFFGDGTCNNGQFFECLNMAALWKLPIIFVVENNLWAIGMSHLRATSDPEIWKKGPAFGMPGYHVDGMDVLKVREIAKEAVERARRGDGPTLIECETYRFRGHSLADPDELRAPAEKAHYAARDPIVALREYLLQNKLASEQDLKGIDKKIEELVEDAVEFADGSPLPVRSQLLENVFADPKGFGIGPDGRYRCEEPGFTAGTAQV